MHSEARCFLVLALPLPEGQAVEREPPLTGRQDVVVGDVSPVIQELLCQEIVSEDKESLTAQDSMHGNLPPGIVLSCSAGHLRNYGDACTRTDVSATGPPAGSWTGGHGDAIM